VKRKYYAQLPTNTKSKNSNTGNRFQIGRRDRSTRISRSDTTLTTLPFPTQVQLLEWILIQDLVNLFLCYLQWITNMDVTFRKLVAKATTLYCAENMAECRLVSKERQRCETSTRCKCWWNLAFVRHHWLLYFQRLKAAVNIRLFILKSGKPRSFWVYKHSV
jgi:hypothetical protein